MKSSVAFFGAFASEAAEDKRGCFMRAYFGMTILAVCFVAAAGFVAVGCNHGSSGGGSSSSGDNNCADACEILYEGCNSFISDANGNELSQSECTSGCNSSHLSSCAGQCNAGAKQNSDCSTFESCIGTCVSGG